ncbi:exosome non-catalytic core subunit RRP40 Ecym_2015 [Eremothecium cymbalariae DBVPG|uniref:Ribosomal RNA-processing protein 40 n=1 Tax=Eremothecium cymbalariae (strain CBS 270.75 / DBVPG 7215 / KCTC 17166 / NRRL Y-17582) TaxID=931890 RepID=G8JNX4_ERECY|nr:Hypothetical protein Ecym_2015 [Eremothecium cymbalariae DBVPG\
MANLVIPGDKLSINNEVPLSLGPGVSCDPRSQEVRPVNAGLEVVSNTKKGQSLYVDYNSKRYLPSVGDYVIGLVTASFSDSYKVSLSSFSSSVVLSYMAFPNATKKNRPTLKVGDLCYARVCSAEKDLEAEIECVDSTTGKDAGFGILEGGAVVEVPLAFARELLFNNQYPFLPILAQNIEFEVAIGLNGKIWIKTANLSTTLACYRAIQKCCKRQPSEFKSTIKSEFKQFANLNV